MQKPHIDFASGLTSIDKVLKKHEDEFLAIKDVTMISIGEENDRPCIKVGVRKKSPDIEKVLPKSLDGYNVVIEETGDINAL